MRQYRIITNGKYFRIQRKFLFWWRTLGEEWGLLDRWEPTNFKTFDEAKEVIFEMKAKRWTVVETILFKKELKEKNANG